MKRMPGMENIRLTVTALTIGMREARHLEGRYRLDVNDLMGGRRFDDAVTSTGFHIDVHEMDPNSKAPNITLPPGLKRHEVPMCDIPYHCLLPKHLTGLLFAGRCLSGTHVAHASYRVTGTCMATGQARRAARRSGIEPDDLPRGRVVADRAAGAQRLYGHA